MESNNTTSMKLIRPVDLENYCLIETTNSETINMRSSHLGSNQKKVTFGEQPWKISSVICPLTYYPMAFELAFSYIHGHSR